MSSPAVESHEIRVSDVKITSPFLLVKYNSALLRILRSCIFLFKQMCRQNTETHNLHISPSNIQILSDSFCSE